MTPDGEIKKHGTFYQGDTTSFGRHVTVFSMPSFDCLAVPGRPATHDDESGLFEWGTRNNRAILLARAILLHTTGKEPSPAMAQAFVETRLSRLDPDHFKLYQNDVLLWVDRWVKLTENG